MNNDKYDEIINLLEEIKQEMDVLYTKIETKPCLTSLDLFIFTIVFIPVFILVTRLLL